MEGKARGRSWEIPTPKGSLAAEAAAQNISGWIGSLGVMGPVGGTDPAEKHQRLA